MTARQCKRSDNKILAILSELPALDEHLFRLVRQIPPGRVTTYGELASRLGDRIACRWVGHRLLHHRHGSKCFCHRVVRADGTLGGYISRNVDDKASRLADEGVESKSDRVDLSRFMFRDFIGERPLNELRAWQERLSGQLRIKPPTSELRLVAGIDVSYQGDSGFAALVVFDSRLGKVVATFQIKQPVRFPYISSYLAFRELPLMIAAVEQARHSGTSFDLLMVDGSGILHPRRCGVASMLGLSCRMPCVGVTKKLLIGKVEKNDGPLTDPAKIIVDGIELGAAIQPRNSSSRLLYVSPGDRVDVSAAMNIVQECLMGRRLPEPIYWADRLSRQASFQQ